MTMFTTSVPKRTELLPLHSINKVKQFMLTNCGTLSLVKFPVDRWSRGEAHLSSAWKKKKKKSQTGRISAGAFPYTLQDLGGFQKLHAGGSLEASENSVLADGLYLKTI